MEAKCLNGTITAGDVVAIAAGEGRFGGGMRIGIVLDITPPRYNGDETFVKVEVTHTSGASFISLPYIKNFPYPERMVKIVP